MDCFLEDHEIGLEPRKTNMLVVDFQSVGSPAQSASENIESKRARSKMNPKR